MLKGFRDFIVRGNVIDLAVAVIVGAAFSAIVASLVSDVFNPLIAATIGQPDLHEIVIHVHRGELKVGNLFNTIIHFIIVTTFIYFAVILPTNAFLARIEKAAAHAAIPPTTKPCPECLSDLPLAAKRCRYCAQPVV